MIAQAETRLQRNPKDGRVWDALARLYMHAGRDQESVTAWQNALSLLGENADREEGLGESLLAVANGVVTAEAKAAFNRAVAVDSNAVGARFYLGLAAEQEGRRDEAATIWRKLIATAPTGAPWVEMVRDALSRVEGNSIGNQPRQSAESIAGAGSKAPEQQNAMIRGMVDRLAERLKQDGTDVGGWLQLIRYYAVLGEHEKARDAAVDARKAVGNDAERLRRLDDGIKELGVQR